MKTDAAHCAGNVERVVEQYGDMLFQICLVMLTNPGDAEDAVQDTLLRYLQKAPNFENAEHEKAWLITVAANRCRDMKRFFVRHPQTNLEEIPDCPGALLCARLSNRRNRKNHRQIGFCRENAAFQRPKITQKTTGKGGMAL